MSDYHEKPEDEIVKIVESPKMKEDIRLKKSLIDQYP